MTQRISLVFQGLLLLAAGVRAGNVPAQISTEEKALFSRRATAQMEQAPYAQAQWGVLVADLASGEEVFSRDADRLFMPASNRKLFTTAFALDVLGADYRFKTTLECNGAIQADGALQGNLIVRASGDPTISGRFRKDQSAMAVFSQWAQAAKDLGIKRVDGGLIVDASCFAQGTRLGEGWSWDYQSDYYAAPVGAFSFNENVVGVRLSPGRSSGQACRISLYPPADCFAIRNETKTTSGESSAIDVHREPESNVIVAQGRLGARAEPEINTVTVEDPSRYGAAALLAAVEGEGIRVRDKAAVSYAAPPSTGNPARVIAEYVSPPLSDVIKEINQSSNNHLAEMVYLAAGRAVLGGPASYEQSRQAEGRFWTSLALPDASRLYAADGSGLSRLNLFTPRSFCDLLRRMQFHKDREAFVNSLAVNGMRGTLQGRMGREAYRQRVFGKTGYISNVSCLSGYLLDDQDRTLVFSILVNHFTCSSSSIKSVQDRMCQWLIDLPDEGRVAAKGAGKPQGGS